jgi:hypothetical protein
MNLLLLILQVGDLVMKEVVPVENLVARLKSIFALNPSVQVNIQNLSQEAIAADTDTMQMVADFQKAHGLPVTVQPPAPPTPITQAPTKS